MEDELETYDSNSDTESETSTDSVKIISEKSKIKKIDEDADDDEYEDLDNNDDDDLEEDEEDLEETEDKPLILQSNFPDLDEEDYDDDDDNENYLQKFSQDIQKTVVQDHHPELHIHNNEEIDSLTTVVRDANGQIIDPLHQTIPFVSRYERARVLGERAKQLNSGAEPFIEIDESIIDGYIIALKEFEEKKIPFIIQRPLPNGASEYWKLKDLEII
jgi:DNA-directed RNA polymerase I, II, and III subunit RPABC2